MRRLLEWKDAKGNPVYLNNKTSSAVSNTNNTSTKYPSQEERYKKLLAQIDKEKRFTYEVITLTDNALVFHLNIDSSKFITIAIVYKPYTNPPVWRLGIDGNKTVDYETWNDVSDVLEVIIKDISSLKESLTTKVPSKLYHATYKQFLNSIKKKGLGNTKKKMWSDSKPGVVYLADDPWVAESYAEESEYIDSVEDPDDYLDNIIILEVDTSKLDSSKLYIDENVLLDADEENSTWEYHGVIPWEDCKIINIGDYNMKTLHEEFKEYENLWKETKTLKEDFDDGEAFTKFKNYIANPENRAKYNASTKEERSAIDKPLYDETEKMLASYDDIELYYDGFEGEWYEDHFSYSRGHYTTGGRLYYPEFTYKIEAGTAYENIDTVLWWYASGKIKDSLPSDEYVQEAFELYTAKKNTKDDEAARTLAYFNYEYYIIYYLEELVGSLHDEIKSIHNDAAMRWAEEHLDGEDSYDRYDFDDRDD